MLLFLLGSLNFMFGRLKDFSCETQELLHTVWVRHAFNLAGLFFVLVVFTRNSPVVSPPKLVGMVFVLYALFLVVCRCDARFLAVILALLVVVFYVEAVRMWDAKRARDGDIGTGAGAGAGETARPADLIRAQTALEVGVLVLAFAGSLVYIGQHSREYRGDKWSWITFWLGDSECKKNSSPMCRGKPCSVGRDMHDGLRRIFM